MKLAKVITANIAMKICITRDITGEQFVCDVIFGKDPEIMCVVFEFHPERNNGGSFLCISTLFCFCIHCMAMITFMNMFVDKMKIIKCCNDIMLVWF